MKGVETLAIGNKICKICGKEYEACHTVRPNLNNEFRWQEVACCEEHGAQYLKQILESRGQANHAGPESARDNAPGSAPKKRSRKKRDEAEMPAADEEMA